MRPGGEIAFHCSVAWTCHANRLSDNTAGHDLSVVEMHMARL